MATNRPSSTATSTKAAMLTLALIFCSPGAEAEAIVTGGKTGTYFAIGNNLREMVAPSLEVRDSKGSWANVEEMSRTKGVTLAIVQSDVYAAFVQLRDSRDVPDATRREYGSLLANLRVFMPLYPEEVHFLVRKDDPAEFIHQIKGRPIWMDVEKSGTYLTALNVYAKMFQQRPETVTPFINPAATGDDEGTRRRRSALMALSDPKFYKDFPRIDVMVLVAGQPVGLLEKSVPANLKLLKFDPTHPSSERILREYRKAEIYRTSYPSLNIVGAGVPTIAVDSYLITANFADPRRNQFIKDFADQFCKGFPTLRERGHAKWKALSWQPGAPLPQLAAGWRYSENAMGPLSSCSSRSTGSPASSQSKACSPQDVVAGLCKPS